MKLFTLVTILCGIFVASSSQANEIRGFYVGAGVGSSGLNDHDSMFDERNDVRTVNDDGNAFKLITGYQITRIIALEAQYTNYGDIDITNPLKQHKTKYTWSPETLSFSANTGYTFDNGLRPFALLGFSYIDLNESNKVLDKENYFGFRYGLGLEYTPPALNGLSLRAGYEADYFYIEDKEESHTSIGKYKFYETYDFSLDSFYISISYKF
ncbi:porin family protein [uncultured Photobacterium sp.]|uniref:porin family protein n=1 Tax=uncultured Photobacterium sp. TaxID=173973 RepID=UPI0026251612|nr:porin family protein [uncultured Photobacterium sp.]